MFIFKAEKLNLYKLMRDDRLHCADQIAALSNDIASMKADIRRLQVSKIVEVVNGEKPRRTEDIKNIKHDKKKSYGREYYYRKKAERLSAEKKNAQQGLIDVKNGVPVTPPSEGVA